MSSDYLMLLGDAEADRGAASSRITDALAPVGMRVRYASGTMTLWGTERIPVLPLPGDGVLIGRLFTQDGIALRDTTGFPEDPRPAQIRKHVLESCWGSYLLVQPDAQGQDGFTMTRAPAAGGNLPCVYCVAKGTGFLTSDISLAVRAGLYRKSIDWGFLTHRLMYPGLKTQRTGLANLLELLPGCSLSVRRSRIEVGQAWSPWDFVVPERRHRDPHEAAAQVRSAVACAVRAWSREDRAILLELSGGLDSSIVAACLRGSDARIVCCNLVTPVPGVDERQYASLMARHLDTELYTEDLGLEKARLEFALPPDSVAPGMGPLQYAIDQTMDAAAERHGATCFYSGGGGDSVFCYLRTAAPAADAFRAVGVGAAAAATRDLADMHQCTLWKAGGLALSKLRRPARSPHRGEATFIAVHGDDAGPEEHPWFAAPANALPGDRERIFDLAGNQLFQNQAARGSRRALRFPLLSQPVMEACLRAPSWMWISGGRNRAVARAAFSDVLPPEILNRQSKATYMSYLGAVYQRNKSQILGFLLGGRLASQGLLDTRAINDFVGRNLPPRDQTFLRMFDLCMVENWVRHQPES